MADNSFHEFLSEHFKVLFILGAEDDPVSAENIDAEITMPDGTRWSGTFLTLAEIGRVMERWRISGECHAGAYFRCPDLVIIHSPGISAMVEALEAALADGPPGDILMPLPAVGQQAATSAVFPEP